jgi:predicted nuclease with TOPRIM domain
MDWSIVAAEPITECTGKSDGDDRAAGSPATERIMDTFDYLDEKVAGLKQEFNDLEASIRRRNEDLARLERAERTLEEKVRGTSLEVRERFDVELAGLSDRAEVLMEVLEANSKKSGELVETISGEANRSAFHVEAEAQRKQADRWRWTSIVLSTCAVALPERLRLGPPRWVAGLVRSVRVS